MLTVGREQVDNSDYTPDRTSGKSDKIIGIKTTRLALLYIEEAFF